jgi:hypothetical protein
LVEEPGFHGIPLGGQANGSCANPPGAE